MEDRLYLFRCSFPLALALTTMSANGFSNGLGWFLAAAALDTGTLIWRRSVKKQIADIDTEKCWSEAGLFHVAAVGTYTIAGYNWVLAEPTSFVVTAVVFGASLMTHCSWVPTMRVWANLVALTMPFTLVLFAAEQAQLLNATSLVLCLMLFGTAAVIMHFNRQKYFETFAQIQAEQEQSLRLDHAFETAVFEKTRAEEASRMKSDFLATMSHEIRTPMNAIMGFSDLLTRMSKEPKTREYAQYIHDASVGLLTVLNDVLIFSKIEAHKIELDVKPLEFSALFESLLFWSAKAREKGIRLDIDQGDIPTDALLADEGRLRQILSNFISNALKFTPEGGAVEVRARVTGHEHRSVRIRFEVEDNGIGFADEVAERLFKPFVQADGEISKTYGGTGLGLAISASLVTLMGGEIGARGRPGKGACFWFEAPFEHSVVPLFRTG